MGVGWRNSPGLLARLLRECGQHPDRVTDVEAAWRAFRSFLSHPVDGLESDPGMDPDAFIVQWGRYGRHDNHLNLTFTRQYAVDVRAAWPGSGWYQPEYWHVDLNLVFDDAPELGDVDQLEAADTGFEFSQPGPDRDQACREVEREIQHHPGLRVLWAGTPVRSSLDMYQAD